MLSNTKIAALIAKAQNKTIAKLELTREKHMERLRELSLSAEAANQYSAAVKSEELRGKVSGLYVEKVEVAVTDLSQTEREQAVLGILTTARKRQKELVS